MTYVKHHACQIVRTSVTRQLPAPTTILSYYHTQSQQETLSIALLGVRIKAAQNGFSYEGTMIYNFLTRDIHIQENGNLFLKRLQNFNF